MTTPRAADCYATSDDLAARFDVRRIGDLLSDDDTRVAAGSFSSNANLYTALTDATQQINSAIRKGNRYTRAEIYALYTSTNTQDNYARQLLTKWCCVLAFAYLVARRGYNHSEIMSQVPFYGEAKEFLDQLASGERILDTSAAADAGRTTYTAQFSSNNNMLTDAASRLLGPRANPNPRPYYGGGNY